ncbi:Integrase catalytic domain-containing protein [Plasmodiophora brassicae]
MPLTIARELMERDPLLTMENLQKPETFCLVDRETKHTAYHVMILDLGLTTTAGELITRRRRCLVWDIPEKEIILGERLLDDLGIHPKKALDVLIKSTPKKGNDVMDEVHNMANEMPPLWEGEEEETEDVRIGTDSTDSLEREMDGMVERALRNGLPQAMGKSLRKLVRRYRDVWRMSIGPDGPARVTPFVTELKPDAEPYRCRARKYSMEDSAFMEEFVAQLKKYGLVVENYNAKWASPVVVVTKPGGGKRFCVDLRAVNAKCVAVAWPMPHQEAILRNLAGSRFWFKLDAFKGFWMMPLDEACQEIFSFMTDKGVYKPTRSMQGGMNSAPQYQGRMFEVFGELMFHKLIIWIDDLMGHAQREDDWFRTLERTLMLAERHSIKFNVEKCELFTTEVRFCGRIFTPEGVRHDPARIEALMAIPQPRTARDLQQFLMATQWMSRSIPEYNRKVHLLQRIYEDAMKDQPGRTKAIARRVRLCKYGWSPEHALAFEKLKMAVADTVQLAYPRKDRIQCLFSDANEVNSAAVVTQIPPEDLGKPVHGQRHEPLGFVGHKFAGPERNWSTVEKEGFAIKDGIDKLDYLVTTNEQFRLFTDHRNLVRIFSPTDVSKPTAQKLQRWALDIQRVNYVIEHIAGEDNVWSDLMTRWGAPDGGPDDQHLEVRTIRRITLQIEDGYRVRPLQRKEFQWPTVDEIRKAQRKWLRGTKRPKNGDDLFVTGKGQVIIPDECNELKLQLCAIAHAGGNSGHLGLKASLRKLGEFCHWAHCDEDMRTFCNACLNCLPTRGGVRIPRPLGTAVHGVRPNQVIHLDWLYMMAAQKGGRHDLQWNLIIRDDLSGMVKITPDHTPNAETTVEALLEWRAIFGTFELMVSDMASCFLANVVKELARRCGFAHHPTVAYGHYSNGSIEVINRNYLQLVRALLSELQWDKYDWPWLNHNIEHTINHRSQARTNGNAPVTVMMGRQPDNPLKQVFKRPGDEKYGEATLSKEHIQELVMQLQTSLNEMHKGAVQQSKKIRAVHRKRSDAYRRATAPNFQIGDYVLIGLPEPGKVPGKKLFMKWRGLYQITDSHENYTYEVRNMFNETDTRTVHGDRVRLYEHGKVNATEELKRQMDYDNERFAIEVFKDCRHSPETGELELLIGWKGFSEAEDSWEPICRLAMDVPKLVKAHAARMRKEKHHLADEVKELLKAEGVQFRVFLGF